MTLPSSVYNANMTASCSSIPEKLNCENLKTMKISIMKVGLCIAGQLSNLTKSKQKLSWQFYMDGKQGGKKKIQDKVLVTPKQTST